MRWIGLLTIAVLSLTGCFRPAGESIDPTVDSAAIVPTALAPDAGVPSDPESVTDTAPDSPTVVPETAPDAGVPDSPTAVPETAPDAAVPDTSVPSDVTPLPNADPAATVGVEILNIQTIAAETALAGGSSPINASPTADLNAAGTTGDPNALTPAIITATAVYITPGAPQVPVQIPTATPLPTNADSSGAAAGDSAGTSGDSGTDADATAAPGSIETTSDGCYYIVEAGDTLYGIALDNGISLEALRAANADANPGALQIGQRLLLPTCDVTPPTDEATLAPGVQPSATPPPTATPVIEGILYTVRPGDTVSAIASRFNVNINDIVQANESLRANRDLLRVGQELIIPIEPTPSAPPTLPPTPTRAATLPVGSPIEPVMMATPTAGG
jgi:LysM repeat protein